MSVTAECRLQVRVSVYSPPPVLVPQQVFSVSERREQQVRFLCAAGSGVWTACRLDPVLRLFDWATGRPLQEVDFTPLATKMLGATCLVSNNSAA